MTGEKGGRSLRSMLNLTRMAVLAILLTLGIGPAITLAQDTGGTTADAPAPPPTVTAFRV